MEKFLHRDRGHNSHGYSKSCLGCFNGSLYFFPFTRSMGKKWTLEVLRIDWGIKPYQLFYRSFCNMFWIIIKKYIYIFNSFRTYLTLDSSEVMDSMTKFLSIKEIFQGFPYLYLESKGIKIKGYRLLEFYSNQILPKFYISMNRLFP